MHVCCIPVQLPALRTVERPHHSHALRTRCDHNFCHGLQLQFLILFTVRLGRCNTSSRTVQPHIKPAWLSLLRDGELEGARERFLVCV